MEYTGGYYTLKMKLVKTGMHRHTEALEAPVSQQMLDVVNIVQRTRWCINPFILETMWEAFQRGDRVGDLPPPNDFVLPARVPEAAWAAMTIPERTAVKAEAARVHGENSRLAGKREALKRKLEIAMELKDSPAIYFPHALDFRGRVYPLPQDLNPQGDDVAKGLLMFADAKPLGDRGMYWLMVSMANAAGEDKATFDERIAWVQRHHDLILDSASDPLDGKRFWTSDTFDAPWQFLALCREYAFATILPGYQSRLPINVDATCSGIQHLSAMGLDPVGARATNLMDSGARQDLYAEVAEAVKQIVSNDAAQAVPEAGAWLGEVDRKTVKRAVMTTPYGVTTRGIRDQLITDGHTKGLDGSSMLLANYMRDCITSALETTVVAAKEIMGYIQDLARALAAEDIPLRWTTPAGMTIQQSYYRLSRSEVQTLFGKVMLQDENKTLGLEPAKNALAAAPNYVHSFDAAHLSAVVHRLHSLGIKHFSLIHDSYGVHASDVDTLNEVIREEFVSMYSVDWLERLEAEVKSYAPDVELPERPKRGTFDLSQVLTSPYFFS